MLLLQRNDIILTIQQLKYYIQLGFTKFCVGSIEQAKQIKNFSSIYEVIGSITMKIEKNIITTEHLLYFDGFVLWFPFNRDIQKIKEMPTNFKYVLLINCGCSKYCDGSHHWITNSFQEEQQIKCPNADPLMQHNYKDCVKIRPQDLNLFNNLISYYKLQGRENPTFLIIRNIVLYTSPLDFYYILDDFNYQEIYNIGVDNV